MVWLGVAITAAAALGLFAAYWRSAKTGPYAAYGWIGFSVIAAAEMALYLEVKPVAVYFTPIVWSGYIMAVDAAGLRAYGHVTERRAGTPFPLDLGRFSLRARRGDPWRAG